MADRLIRITTAIAVVIVATVAAVISYRRAYELVRMNGESGTTARLVPFTVDGLIWAASMVILDASRRRQSIPALAKWSLGVGITATIGANVAHGLTHGPIGAVVGAWPALALAGSFELLMTLTRKAATPQPGRSASEEAAFAEKLSRHRRHGFANGRHSPGHRWERSSCSPTNAGRHSAAGKKPGERATVTSSGLTGKTAQT